MYTLSIHVDGRPVAKCTYSLDPKNYYTEDKDPSDFMYIDLIITYSRYKRHGYATKLLDELVEIYPDKTILAKANKYSKDLLLKYGAILIKDC